MSVRVYLRADPGAVIHVRIPASIPVRIACRFVVEPDI